MAITAFKQITDNAVSTSSTSFANTGVTSIGVLTGDGLKFPTPGNGFYLTIWNGTGVGSDPNAEKVFVTAKSGDTLTSTPTTKIHTTPCNVALLDVAQNTLDLQTAVNALESGTNGGGNKLSSLGVTSVYTAPATVTANSRNSIDATGGSVTMTLPTGTAVGQTVFIQKSDTSSNIVYISGNVNGTGGSNLPLRTQLQGKLLQWDGVGTWNIIAGDLSLSSLDARYAVIGSGGGGSSSVYDITTFGAKVDGKIYNVFSTTASSTTVTLTGGTFTSADIGKVIILHRVGASNAELVTTITAVASSTSITVGTAPSITSTGVMGAYGTDDTTAYQTAITAVNSNTNAGNAIITIPAGISMLNGAQVSGTSGGGTYSGQILFPSRNHSLPIHSFVFRGASSQAGPDTSGPQSGTQQYPPNNGTILLSTATTGSVFDCIPATSGSLVGRFTFINAVFENLIVRCLPAVNTTALNLEKANSAQVNSCIIDTFCGVTDTLAWGTTGAGIFMPQVDNSANCLVQNSWVSGYYYGVKHAECTHFSNVSVYLCYVGISVERGYHDATYARVTLSQNVIMFQANPNIGVGSSIPATTIRGFVDFEHAATSKPYTNIYDFDDPSNKLRGYLRIHLVQGGVGLAYDYRYNGAAFLHIVNEQGMIGAGELVGFTVYNPATLQTVAATGTLADVDATNAVVTFIAPPSRSVIVEVCAVASLTGDAAQLNVGLREGSTAVGSQAELGSISGTATTRDISTIAQIYVTGITAVSHTYKLAIVSSGTAALKYGGPSSIAGAGPLVIRVIAAA